MLMKMVFTAFFIGIVFFILCPFAAVAGDRNGTSDRNSGIMVLLGAISWIIAILILIAKVWS